MNRSENTLAQELSNLGFRLAGFRDMALEKALRTLAGIGYKSVEFCLEHPDLSGEKLTPATIASIKEILEECGLRISSISSHGKKDDIPTTLRRQMRGLEIAQELGTQILVVGTALAEADPDGRLTLKALGELLRAADDAGITVAVEPEPETVMGGMFDFSMLACRMAGLPLALNLDVGHAFLTERDVLAVIENWASFIVHTHIDDVSWPHHVHLLPGDGHLDIAQLIRALRKYGYHGDFTLDYFDITDDPEDWASRVMARCRDLLS